VRSLGSSGRSLPQHPGQRAHPGPVHGHRHRPSIPGPDDHIQFISDFEEFLDANGVFQISTASTGDYDVVACYNPIKNNKEVPNELSCNLVGHGLRDGGGTLGVVQTFSNLSVRDHKYCGFCPEEA